MVDRIVSLVMVCWLAVMVVGLASLLIPVILFVAGFVGMLLVLRFIGWLVVSLLR